MNHFKNLEVVDRCLDSTGQVNLAPVLSDRIQELGTQQLSGLMLTFLLSTIETNHFVAVWSGKQCPR